jgi:hypothetical protein
MKPVRLRAVVWLSVLASAVLILWVADGIAGLERQPGYPGHYYQYLTEGFVRGHTYMAIAPARELAGLPDPYDPAQNRPYRLSDASYYQGRYYLYYGPTPIVVLMLPWRLLTGSEMPERVAAAVFAAAALAGLGLLLLGIRDRCFPQLAEGWVGALLFTALAASWLPVTLRRAGFWELPHAAALACLWWTLYFIWRCYRDPGQTRWVVAVGVGIILLLGSRPTYLFAAALMALVALGAGPSPLGPEGRRFWRRVGALAVPLALGGAALLAYNLARFGHAGEFGQSYQLLNGTELRVTKFRPDFIPFNFWVYFLSVPQLSPYFPFVKTVWPASLPPGYIMPEEMVGAFLALPVHFAGWVALAWVWRRRGDPQVRPVAWAVGTGAVTSLLATAIMLCWLGATSRYLTEIGGGWTLATCVGLMVLLSPRGGASVSRGRAGRALATAAMAWTVGAVWLASFEHGGIFRRASPVAYARIARVLDYPSLWVARAKGQVFGPVELMVELGAYRGPETLTLLATGRLNRSERLQLERIDPGHVRITLRENDAPVAEIRDLAAGPDPLLIQVEAPWLYPPPEHPWWDRVTDPAERRDRQSRFALAAAGRSAVGFSLAAFDATGLNPTLPAADGQGSVRVVDLHRLSHRAP